jgi:hypothetical protein
MRFAINITDEDIFDAKHTQRYYCSNPIFYALIRELNPEWSNWSEWGHNCDERKVRIKDDNNKWLCFKISKKLNRLTLKMFNSEWSEYKGKNKMKLDDFPRGKYFLEETELYGDE